MIFVKKKKKIKPEIIKLYSPFFFRCLELFWNPSLQHGKNLTYEWPELKIPIAVNYWFLKNCRGKRLESKQNPPWAKIWRLWDLLPIKQDAELLSRKSFQVFIFFSWNRTLCKHKVVRLYILISILYARIWRVLWNFAVLQRAFT